MNKTAIRNFAVWARNKLIADVSYHAGLMGITKNGIAKALPQSTNDVEFFDIGTAEPYAVRGEAIQQRKSLVEAIRQKEKDSNYETAYSSLMEEVAYTWFNRLIAVRFMEVNDYLPAHVRVLSSESGKQEPDIVTNPFDAELFFAEGENQKIIQMKNDNKLDEVFRILFVKQCRELSRILPRLFEGTNDYTELLLSVSFIDQEGVVYHLVHDIPEEDFNIEQGGQVEIIGWLYQYYNAELKDETFALLKNNVKVTKERIPSATQLFTPDWIVRYMVENSLGRLWIEGHPNDLLKSGWKYYLDEAEQEESVKQELEKINAEYAKLSPEDIKVIDPCMGSGHILVYAFDVLMQIYESAGYTQRDAAKSIIEKNLFGLDIDDRAAQLAYFAVMMKARQYNRRILDGVSDCNVYAIKESNGFDRAALVKMGDDLKPVAEKLVDTFVDAKEYGSILNVDLTLEELDALDKRLDDVDRMSDYGNLLDMMYASILCNELSVLIRQARVMAQKYETVVTNPPYMGNGSMNSKLVDYVQKFYSVAKNDMFSVFVQVCRNMTKEKAYYAMITQPSLLFLQSFMELRKKMINENQIVTLLHMGRGIFGIDFGSTSFVIRNMKSMSYYGGYFRLHQRTFQYIDPNDIEKLYLNALNNREYVFDFTKYNTDKNTDDDIETISEDDNKPQRLFFACKQNGFTLIPGVPFAYWVSERVIKAFQDYPKVRDFAKPVEGIKTGSNETYLRLWYELNRRDTMLIETDDSDAKWRAMTKGGDYRRWYGNLDYVVLWGKDGSLIKDVKGASFPNRDLFFTPALTWTYIISRKFSIRMVEDLTLHNNKGPACYLSDEEKYYLLGFLNTKVAASILQILAPTIDCKPGNIGNMPVKQENKYRTNVNELTKENVEISKSDWDSYEISWGFKKHPLM